MHSKRHLPPAPNMPEACCKHCCLQQQWHCPPPPPPLTSPCRPPLAPQKQDISQLNALLREVQTLHSCGSHPNIVRFCGVCLNPLRIVTEYYGKGSLAAIVSKAEQQVGACAGL
jgi:serine/threonine protein kinase